MRLTNSLRLHGRPASWCWQLPYVAMLFAVALMPAVEKSSMSRRDSDSGVGGGMWMSVDIEELVRVEQDSGQGR